MAVPVDIDRMVEWHLFGEAGATAQAVIEASIEVETDSREGIEEGARETSLQLKLRGIVASTEDGLGYAIIENANQQAIYCRRRQVARAGQCSFGQGDAAPGCAGQWGDL